MFLIYHIPDLFGFGWLTEKILGWKLKKEFEKLERQIANARKENKKMKPGEEIINGYLIQRTRPERWPEDDPDGRKGFKWRHTSWACYDGKELVCVCTCRRGARAVAEYLAKKGIRGKSKEVK